MPNNDYANEPNQSRSEDIIQSILDNTEYNEDAGSRIEYLLIELKNAIEGGGGGGGVTSYSPLTEKPKIDNHTLQAGNNTSSDLGLQTKLTFDSAPTESSTNPVTSGGVYTALAAKANAADVYNKSSVDTALSNKADKSTTYTKSEVDTALSSKQNTISDLSTIRSGAAAGATAVQPISGKGLSTNDYTNDEKTKLAGIDEGAEVNEIESIKVNNTTINPDANKVVNITGLQTELSASNKLNPAYIDYDSTHRAVSDTEKSVWNSKQNALSSTQLDAVNSGIDSTKVAQIETNENNILLSEQMNGAKNLLKFDEWANTVGVYNGTKSVSGNTISLTSTGAGAVTLYNASNFPARCKIPVNVGDVLVFTWDTTYTGSGAYIQICANGTAASGTEAQLKNKILVYTVPSGTTYVTWRLGIYSAVGITVDCTDMMIQSKASYDAGFTDYQPYAMSNAELTAKEQQNENNISLLETMNGAKNALNISTIEKSSNITTTLNSDKTITLSVTSANARSYVYINGDSYIQNVYSNYILVWDNGGNQAINCGVTYSNNGTSWANESFNNTGSSIEINSNYQYLRFSMYFEANTAITNATVKIMLITKSAYNAGFTDYQPYAMSNAELTAKEQQNENNILIVDISDKITAADGYTINSLTKLYMQGSHVFGHLIVSKNGGNFGGAQETIARFSNGYRPRDVQVQGCFFGTTEYNTQYTGYAYIQLASASSGQGSVIVKGYQTDVGTVANIHVDFIV